MAATGAVHLILAWLLTHYLGPGVGTEAFALPKDPMLVFDIGGGGGAKAQKETPLPLPPAWPADTLVDLGTSSEAPRPEWTVARIAAPAAPAAIAAAATAADAPGAGTGGSGGGGAEGYDPFAGAAPLRREPAEALTLDTAALEEIRAAVARLYPRAAGTVEMRVRISAEGLVLEAQVSGGSAPEVVKAALRRSVTGKRLFRDNAASQGDNFKLPLLHF